RERVQHIQRETADGEETRELVIDEHDHDDERDRDDRGTKPLVDRILTEARTDAVRLGDAELHRKRAGVEHEREVLRIREALAAHRDLSARADRALDDRRTTHHATIEDDRHVVADVLAGLVAEATAAFVAERELDDRAVRRALIRTSARQIV